MSDASRLRLDRGDIAIAYRRGGSGPPLLLLHATLSSSRQLRGLATTLAQGHTVLSVDRRGSGASQPAGDVQPVPIDVAVHVADLVALLDAEGIHAATVVGHSYGGCLALELAARHPDRVGSIWAYEPPYASVASVEVRATLEQAGSETARAAREHGPRAAAEAFLVAVSGPEALARLSPRARTRIGQAGRGAIADATLLGMEPDGLAAIRCPVELVTGGNSQPAYAEIADRLAERIPEARRATLEGMEHMAPITRPEVVAGSISEFVSR